MSSESTTADPVVDGNGIANPQTTTQPLMVDTSSEPVIDQPEPVIDPVPVPPSGKVPDWFQKRFNELAGQRNGAVRLAEEAEERAKSAEARNADLIKQMAKNTPGTPPIASLIPPTVVTDEEIDRRALEKAKNIARTDRFNETCNGVAETGKKEFKDWDDALKNLALVGAIGDPTKVSSEFLETVVELKNPHQILHHLGTNPEEAARIAVLPPKKMALELARVESTLNNKPAEKTPVSSAPAPVIPLSAKSTLPVGTLDDPSLSSADWFELRAKQIEEKRNRYRRA